MKKILMINCYAGVPGYGRLTRHYDFGRQLVNEGYEVTVAHSSFDHYLNDQIGEVKEANGVKFYKVYGKGYKGNISRIISEVKFFLELIKNKDDFKEVDIFLGSSGGLFNGLTAYGLSRLLKKRFIFEIRDIWPETWVEMGAVSRRNPIYLVFRLLEIFLYKKADKIVTLLPGMYKHLEKSNISSEKVIWISNGVDLKKFDKEKEGVSSDIKLDKSKFNILYTGSIGKANVLHNLVEVAKYLKNHGKNNIIINIVGKGPLEAELKTQSKDLDNIKFLGAVMKEEIPGILCQADSLIVTMKKGSLYKYGISLNKSYEYLASGKPIIFSGNVMNDFVVDGNAGISVDAEDAQQICEAIIELFNTPKKERKELGDNGRRYVEENFDISILAKKLAKELNKLLGEKNNE